MYIGKTDKGIDILLVGWLLVIYIVPFKLAGIILMTIILGIIILAYWIWQSYDVNKLAKYHNEYLIENEKVLGSLMYK